MPVYVLKGRTNFRLNFVRPSSAEFGILVQRDSATGITDYLTNGGKLEVAQRMAGHSNAKTTGIYDRSDDVSLSEVEKIGI